MSSRIYDEHSFEDAIEAQLLKHGQYEKVNNEEFNRGMGLFPDKIVNFVKETQPEVWEELKTAHKDNARKAFLRDLRSALERQGALEVLRHGLRTTGTTVKLAYFQPATSHNPEVEKKYKANSLGVTRHYKPRLVYFLPHFQRPFL
jgi:type I restriction enzyme R subunit